MSGRGTLHIAPDVMQNQLVAHVAQGADLIITIVGCPADVEEVYFEDDEIIAHAKAESYLIIQQRESLIPDATAGRNATARPNVGQKIFELSPQSPRPPSGT